MKEKSSSHERCLLFFSRKQHRSIRRLPLLLLIHFFNLLPSSLAFVPYISKNNKYVPSKILLHVGKSSQVPLAAAAAAASEEHEVTEMEMFPPPPSQPAMSQVDRFHTDMVRALESRQRLAQQHYSVDTIERHQRPSILSHDVDGAERVQKMLQHMIDIELATEESFVIVMKAFLQRGRTRWAKPISNDEKDNDNNNNDGGGDEEEDTKATIICAADQLEELLEKLEDWGTDIQTDTYNLVLEAYATCATPRGDRDYARRADALFQRMEAMGKTDVHSLAHMAHAWSWQQANLQSGTCAERAYDITERFRTIATDEHSPLLLQCYDWVLEAFSKSAGSWQKARDIFQQMNDISQNLEIPALPDAQSYSNVILACSKSGERGSAQIANDLLLELVNKYSKGMLPPGNEPELIAFNGVISAWSRMGRTDKAESALWLMDDLRTECKRLVPDKVSYNSVLHAHVKNRDKAQALRKAIALVQHMEDHSQVQPSIRPDAFTYSTLMKAWVHSGRPDAAENAAQIYLKMEQRSAAGDTSVTPHVRNVNVVLNAYAKSRDRSATQKAHALLRRLQESETLEPDIISYTSVIECYSKSSDPKASEAAENLLQEAFEEYEKTGNPEMMPNLRTFTMVIQALAKCPREGNAAKARLFLSQLTEMYEDTMDEKLKPNEFPYNYVINCAANTFGTQEDKVRAFRIATQTYQEMRTSTYVKPDSFTYAFWIKACNNLLPISDLHCKCVSLAFEQCKSDGLVTKEVLNRLQSELAPETIQDLLEVQGSTGYRHFQVQDLPRSWSSNTPGWNRGFNR